MKKEKNGEKLSEAMSYIDDRYADAEKLQVSANKMKKNSRRVKIIALAAAAAIVLCAIPAGVFMALRNLGDDIIDNITKPDPIVFDGGAYSSGDVELPDAFSKVSVTAEGVEGKIIPCSGSFIITTASKTDVDTLTDYITISPKTNMGVEQLSDTEFKVTAASGELTPGTVYRVTVGDPENPSSSFAFQTETELVVKSILPDDLTLNVPVNTGIEVTFSDSVSGTDYADFIKISPEVKGKYRLYPDGRTLAFVPDSPLEYDTVYTVSVKEGISGISGKTLVTGTESSFRTQTKDYSSQQNGSKSYLFIETDSYSDVIFSPGLEASLTYYVYGNKIKSIDLVNAKLYAFDSVEKAAKAITKYQQSLGSGDDAKFDLSSLKYIGEYKSTKISSYSESTEKGAINFGTALERGVYIAEITAEATSSLVSKVKSTKYAIIQISNLRPYTASGDGKTLVWINSDDGKPASGLEVGGTAFTRNLGWDSNSASFVSIKAERTDDNGLSSFASKDTNAAVIYAVNNKLLTASKQTVAKGDGIVICAMTVAEEAETYNMKYVYTDRETYFSSDKINYYGFAVNSYTGEVPKKLYLQTGNSVVKQAVDVRADGSFSGSFSFEQMGATYLYLKFVDENGNVICSKNVKITEEEKPQVTATLEFDKTFYRRGETGKVTLTATFFDGTPVEGLSFLIRISGFKARNDSEKTLMTDADGRAELQFTTAKVKAYSTNPVYISATAELVDFETQSLYLSESVPYFHSEYVYETVYGNNTRTLTLNYRDFSDFSDPSVLRLNLYGATYGAAAKGEVKYSLRKYVITKKLQSNYDSYTKLTSYSWKYTRTESLIESGNYTFKDGKISLPMYEVKGFTGGYYYELSFYDDTSENTYETTVSATLNAGQSINNGNYRKSEIVLNKDYYVVGDKIEAQYLVDGTAAKSLFILSADGIENYTVGEKFTGVYGKSMIPGAVLYAVQFDPDTGIYMYDDVNLIYDVSAAASFGLTIKTDKESYKPGETAKITVHSDEVSGAAVLLSVVDEACFALGEQNLDVSAFFSSSSKNGSYENRYYPYEIYGDLYTYYYNYSYSAGKQLVLNRRFEVETASYSSRTGFLYSDTAVEMAASVAEAESGNSKSSDSTQDSYYIRKYFADNPEFALIYLDKNGTGTYVFTVPDNITSWRVTALASAGLGTGIENMKLGCAVTDTVCTQPFFLNVTACQSYIVGDTVSMAARAYGTAASGKVSYTAVLYTADGQELERTTAAADSKTRAWLKFKSLDAGQYKVVVYGKLGDNTDALEQNIQVIESAVVSDVRRTVTLEEIASIQAKYYPVVLTFTNPTAAGRTYEAIASRLARGDDSARTDMLLAKYIALGVMGNLYGLESSEDLEMIASDISSRIDGSTLRLLSYSSGDYALTAEVLYLCPGILSKYSDSIITACYEMLASGKFESEEQLCQVMCILASLGEPVLDRLYTVSGFANSYSDEAKLYLAMAFAASGDWSAANSIYTVIRDKYAVYDSEYGTMYLKQDTLDEGIALTNLALMVASRTNRQDAVKMAEYLAYSYSETEPSLLSLTAYLKSFLPVDSVSERSFSYSVGDVNETVMLKSGRSYSISLNKSDLANLKISDFDDGIVIRAAYRGAPTEEELSGSDASRISIEKKFDYCGNGMYKVSLTISGTSTRVCEYFSLYDTIPSGARFVVSETKGWESNKNGSVYTGAGIWNRSGQNMTGYVSIYNDIYTSGRRASATCPEYKFSITVSYVIRGAVEGTFIAEPAFIRMPATGAFVVSERYTVGINENSKWSFKAQ